MVLVSLLMLTLLPTAELRVPRPCRDEVVVAADVAVERVGTPEGDPLVRWVPQSGGPRFPAELRSVGQGRVTARFVVDTTGRVLKGSAMILSESHRAFGQSVCQFLERQALFSVQPVAGKKVRVEVRGAPFHFETGR